MKKTLSFCLIAFVVFSACSKQMETNSIDYEKVAEVMNFKGSNSEKILSIGMLSPGEKAYAWKEHLKEYLSKPEMTPTQKALLEKSIAFINPSLYIKEEKDKYAGELSLIEYELSQAFSTKDFYSIFHSLQKITTTDQTTQSNITTESNCTCRSDMYCSLGDDLSVCDWNIGCSGGNNCGIFSSSQCKGNCTRYPVILD